MAVGTQRSHRTKTQVTRLTRATTGVCLAYTTTTLIMLATQRALRSGATSMQTQTPAGQALGTARTRGLKTPTGTCLVSTLIILTTPTVRDTCRLQTITGAVPITAKLRPNPLDGTCLASIMRANVITAALRSHTAQLEAVGGQEQQVPRTRTTTVCFTMTGVIVEAGTRLMSARSILSHIRRSDRSTVTRTSLMVCFTTARKRLRARLAALSIHTAQDQSISTTILTLSRENRYQSASLTRIAGRRSDLRMIIEGIRGVMAISESLLAYSGPFWQSNESIHSLLAMLVPPRELATLEHQSAMQVNLDFPKRSSSACKQSQ